MPSPPVEFKEVYNSQQIRALHRAKKFAKACIMAEGLIDGKVVATAKRWPAKRPARIELRVDADGAPVLADGSDMVVVIASLVDEQGNVKRLGKDRIAFDVSGEGTLIGNHLMGANPRELEWGTAPCLIQATARAGKIRVKARTVYKGINTPLGGEVYFETVPAPNELLFSEEPGLSSHTVETLGRNHRAEGRNDLGLDEVGAQQSEFEHH